MLEDPHILLRRLADEARFDATQDRRLKRIEQTQRQRDAQLLLEHVHETNYRVFYPGAGQDWEPLHRLTHLCDTFIFCDFGVSAGTITGEFGLPGLATDFIQALDADTIAYLSDHDGLPDNVIRTVGRFLRPTFGQPWGKYARLTRTVGNVRRSIHFLYLGIEGVSAFFNLFIPTRTAPRAICLNFSCDPNGAAFYDWNGPLGQLVQRCERSPTHLVGGGGPDGNWPYHRAWQMFGGWLPCWAAQEYLPEPVQASQLGGTRKVIVRLGRLAPEDVAGCEALVLPIRLYVQHQQQWPVGARVLLLAPSDQAGQLHGDAGNVVFLGHRHDPLGDVLARITETCAQLGVRRVSSVGIGYEDEGPELDQWRRQPGAPLDLTIYCEHAGDVESFGPYADEIQCPL